MSEYQYYEFRAIDRPLTREEQGELRAYSTRAEITGTRFTNAYDWGDFKGDVEAWMDHYFDAFLYLANWGTRVLKLRIPDGWLGEDTLKAYCAADTLLQRKSGANRVLTFELSEFDAEDWHEEEGVLDTLIGIRDELLTGDLRSLYLGWLMAVDYGELEEEDPEPPVPFGLSRLTEAQKELVSFFDISQDLIASAAQASPPVRKTESSRGQIDRWLAQIPPSEKDDLLARLIAGEEANLARALWVQAVRQEPEQAAAGRTVGELLASAEKLGEERERIEAEQRAEEMARREREMAAARNAYLNALTKKVPAIWDQLESLVAEKKAARYDQAVGLLIDLRDLAARGDRADFDLRMQSFRTAHVGKPALIRRIDEAGL